MKRAILGTYWTTLKDAKKDAIKLIKKGRTDFIIVQTGKAYIVVSTR